MTTGTLEQAAAEIREVGFRALAEALWAGKPPADVLAMADKSRITPAEAEELAAAVQSARRLAGAAAKLPELRTVLAKAERKAGKLVAEADALEARADQLRAEADAVLVPARQAVHATERTLGELAGLTERHPSYVFLDRLSGPVRELLADRAARHAEAIVELIREWAPVLPSPAVVTVPPQGASYPGTYYAAALAQEVARLLGVPFRHTLERHEQKHWHGPMHSLQQGAFTATVESGTTYIVVDDLITSGATMRRSLEALRTAGVPAFGFAYNGS